MATSTTDNPFAPRGTLTRERIERYVRGELTPAEQHEVELMLEQDPLSRDAVEGLQHAGALEALGRSATWRPASMRGSGRTWSILGGLVVAVIAVLMIASPKDEPPPPVVSLSTPDLAPVPVTEAEHTAFKSELREATALPESLRSAFRGGDRFVQLQDTVVPVERTDPPPPVEALPPATVDPPPIPDEKPRTVVQPKSSRKLMSHPHLKLVDPSELYPIDPILDLSARSVDARYSDAQARADAEPPGNRIPYDRYFRMAMNKFMRGDRQGCLEDLFVVLEEYPEDVNALFYAGLCCYDLGLFPRAAVLLDRARTHEVDTFSEEAEWYHALAVERAYGPEQALPLLNAVVERGGFYAGRATEHLAAKP